MSGEAGGCPGCGTEIPASILCCDPCWARIPTRVVGYPTPWRTARRTGRAYGAWKRFEDATNAARAWLDAHPAAVVGGEQHG